jgi:hypothetical protein
MKYVVDIDALKGCLDCIDCIKVNGGYYIEITIIKEFIDRFPKESLNDFLEFINANKVCSPESNDLVSDK